jgi:hypothetical protein
LRVAADKLDREFSAETVKNRKQRVVFTDATLRKLCWASDDLRGGTRSKLFASGNSSLNSDGAGGFAKQHEIFICEMEAVISWLLSEKERGETENLLAELHIDNVVTQGGIIKGFSTDPVQNSLISRFWSLVLELGISCWVERVPTKANCADWGTRDMDWKLIDLGYVREALLSVV